MTALSILQLLALVTLLTAAVYTDLKERRIPNKVTMSGLLAALVLAGLIRGGFPTAALSGALLAVLVSFPFFALGGLGAGDAKLLMAVGAFVGPAGLLSVAIYGGLAGGVLALGRAAARGTLLPVLMNSFKMILFFVSLGRFGERLSLDSPGADSIPYGLAIAAGALAAWFAPLSLGGTL
jgi:prepilin peptidase CpaA